MHTHDFTGSLQQWFPNFIGQESARRKSALVAAVLLPTLLGCCKGSMQEEYESGRVRAIAAALSPTFLGYFCMDLQGKFSQIFVQIYYIHSDFWKKIQVKNVRIIPRILW